MLTFYSDDLSLNPVEIFSFFLLKKLIEKTEKGSILNFRSMIYDHDVAAIVVLNCPPSKLLVLKNFIDFWPQSSILQSARPSEDVFKQFGPVFTVESLSREEKLDGDLGIWQLKVCKKEIAPHK